MKFMNTLLALAIIGGSTAGLFGMEEKKQEKKQTWKEWLLDSENNDKKISFDSMIKDYEKKY